jgi:hypothetical protein
VKYTPEQVIQLINEHHSVKLELESLYISVIIAAESLTNERAKEYMLHGAARRINLLRYCLSNVFRLFPPATKTPITQDILFDTQINLQAFVINLYGLFENLAWSFVLRHGLEHGNLGVRSIFVASRICLCICYAYRACQGLNISTPVSSKSATFRVTTVMP